MKDFVEKNEFETEEYQVELAEESSALPVAFEKSEIKTDSELIEYKGKLKKFGRAKAKNEEKTFEEEDYSAFRELAYLRNTTVTEIKDECCSFQIKTLMNGMGKVLVRYEVGEKEMERIMQNASVLGMKEVTVSPANLKTCAKAVQKFGLEKQKVALLIDFPFGESTFESKLFAIKEGKKSGVDGITVTLPPNVFGKSQKKELKRQLKKIRRSFKKADAGVAVNAEGIIDEQLKSFLKLAEKAKLNHVAFLFGAVGEQTLINKMEFANKFKGKLAFKVLANVETAAAVMNLFKLNVNVILTPYADDIAKDLLVRFKVKSLKLK